MRLGPKLGLCLALLASMAALQPGRAQVSPFAWPDVQSDQVQWAQPTGGATVAVGAGKTALFIDNAALLATLTVTMPTSPADGQRVIIASAAGITVLTVSGGTVKGAVTTLSVNGWARYNYSTASAAWFRTG